MVPRLVVPLLLLPLVSLPQPAPKTQLVQCRMISGRAPHSAYTDLIRFHDRWFCVFREGRMAASRDGAVRVLTSADGEIWIPSALLSLPDADLREPKLSATPDGRLLLNAVAMYQDSSGVRRRTLVWLSGDGREWTPPQPAGDPGIILYRPAWHLGRGYAMGYSALGAAPLRLYTSTDGVKFTPHALEVPVPGEPTETSLLFLPDGAALSLARREGTAPTVQLGRSRSPYRAWTWHDLAKTIAGPNLIRLPDGRILAAGRLVDDTVRTSLCWLDPEQETLTEFFALPSSGDTGYPGLAFHEGMLWVSYYSSHEGQAMIYLAKLKLPPAGDGKKAPKRLTFGE
jgi:hypothetical protein